MVAVDGVHGRLGPGHGRGAGLVVVALAHEPDSRVRRHAVHHELLRRLPSHDHEHQQRNALRRKSRVKLRKKKKKNEIN